MIDAAADRTVATLRVGRKPEGVAVEAGGPRVYVSNTDANTLNVINADTRRVIATVPVGAAPEGVAVSRR